MSKRIADSNPLWCKLPKLTWSHTTKACRSFSESANSTPARILRKSVSKLDETAHSNWKNGHKQFSFVPQVQINLSLFEENRPKLNFSDQTTFTAFVLIFSECQRFNWEILITNQAIASLGGFVSRSALFRRFSDATVGWETESQWNFQPSRNFGWILLVGFSAGNNWTFSRKNILADKSETTIAFDVIKWETRKSILFKLVFFFSRKLSENFKVINNQSLTRLDGT